jgi:hypothetical protein
MPRLVDSKGKGKYSFTLTGAPLLSLDSKGFGLLGQSVNYYGFHSVIALIRFLANKHLNNQSYLAHLTQVAGSCGRAHIFNAIATDIVLQANAILKIVESKQA